jgi:HIV Tat-specific factor 1
VYQYHPEGVVSIKFRTDDAAQACLKLMNGRFFGGRQLTAEMWDGLTNYNVKKPKETAEEQAARLERFAAEIEETS